MGDVLIVLIVILGIVLLWRGPKTLPKLGAALGRTVREAREEATKSLDDGPEPPPADVAGDGEANRRP